MEKILIVDDEREIVELLEDFLDQQGYSIAKAYSKKEALEQVEKFLPSLVLLDIKLPDGGGLDILQDIKDTHPEMEVIMITGLADKEIALESIRRGAADYICKPIDLNYLLTSVLSRVLSAYKGD